MQLRLIVFGTLLLLALAGHRAEACVNNEETKLYELEFRSRYIARRYQRDAIESGTHYSYRAQGPWALHSSFMVLGALGFVGAAMREQRR